MMSRREFAQRAVGAGIASFGLPSEKAIAEAGIVASRRSEEVIFETVRTDGLAHLSYLIGDRSTGHAAVVDPRRDVVRLPRRGGGAWAAYRTGHRDTH